MINRSSSLSFLLASVFFALQLLCFNCATPVAPDGGPKDEIPPILDTVGTTPNFQTNFEKQRIELTFDEWIKLDDVFNQVVISPPLQKKYVTSLKGKTLRFDFDEEEILRDSATYTINFGEAVKDLTESNPAENLRFVFSTGDFLDSLEMSGTIVDALTNEPVEKVLFMLYENLADSVVRTNLPFYFAKTDKSGRFTIRNIKSGTFKGFALQDDFRYTFDQPNEKIGFPNEFILINDTTENDLKIKLFQEDPLLRVQEVDDKSYGLLKVTFNQKPYDIDLVYELTDQTVLYEFEKDTLKVWYDQPVSEKWKFFVRKDTTLNDTINVPALDRAEFIRAGQLKTLEEPDRRAQKINPNAVLTHTYNHPLTNFDANLINLYEDTTHIRVIPEISIDSIAFRNLQIKFPWKEAIPYELEIMPGAVTDFFGLTNQDTFIQNYSIELIKSLGIIDLTVNNLSADTAYVIELLAGESTLIDTIRTQGQTSIQRRFEQLKPGKFSVRIITDINGNGRWDTGNYDLMLQPEPIFKRELEALRANWEVKAEVALGVVEPKEEEEEEE